MIQKHDEFFCSKVQFQGEAGVDVGGLSREFFTLLMDEIRQNFWKKGTLIHNSKALKVIFLAYIFHNKYTKSLGWCLSEAGSIDSNGCSS